jgi:probable F420-dependent oxidoreductase
MGKPDRVWVSCTIHPVLTYEGKPVRLGLVTPVVTMLPKHHAGWEEAAGIDEVAQLAIAADRLGYEHISCSEHVAVPFDAAAERGGRYWDPLATFGYLSALTTRVRFLTNVLVLGYHHPLEIVKRYGTLDQVTNGRLILGLGVGSLAEEFALLGAAFDDRGARADDAMRALRASLSTSTPAYDGPYYSYDNIVVDPCARQARVPLWIGGRSARSLRRAVELGDGWMPFGLNVEALGTMITAATETTAWDTRSEPLEVLLQNSRPADPSADPDGTRQIVSRLTGIGATSIQLRLVHHSVEHYTEQLEAMIACAD